MSDKAASAEDEGFTVVQKKPKVVKKAETKPAEPVNKTTASANTGDKWAAYSSKGSNDRNSAPNSSADWRAKASAPAKPDAHKEFHVQKPQTTMQSPKADAAKPYPTISIPRGFSAEERKEITKLLIDHKDMLLIRNDDGKFMLIAFEFKDWLFKDDGSFSNRDYWHALNTTFGNNDFTLASVQLMLQNIGFTQEAMDSIDLRNVEFFCGAVVKGAIDDAVWAHFAANLEHGCRLTNEYPLCNKLKFLCGVKENGVVNVVVKNNKSNPRTDFIGGKVTLAEYRLFTENDQDMKVLFTSCLREALEELNVTAETPVSEVQMDAGTKLLVSPTIRCKRGEEFMVTMTVIQVAPYFVKFVISN